MLKWAMRIVAVGGALLAMAVGTAAWMHRTQGRIWHLATPLVCSNAFVSPQWIDLGGWLRRDGDPANLWNVGRYGLVSADWGWPPTARGPFGNVWYRLAIKRCVANSKVSTYYEFYCSTRAMIAVLLLPMGLWAGIGWRQRRQAAAGHCVNCGYDLRATPDKCPECGKAVG